MMPEEWARGAHVAWVVSDDRTVVLHLDAPTATPIALEGAAAAVWASLGSQPRSFEAIVAELAEAYDTTSAAIAADVRGFLAELRAADLVTTV